MNQRVYIFLTPRILKSSFNEMTKTKFLDSRKKYGEGNQKVCVIYIF
jgi:hypothetical protein